MFEVYKARNVHPNTKGLRQWGSDAGSAASPTCCSHIMSYAEHMLFYNADVLISENT